MGMALRGYYTSERHDEPWIDSHLDIRDPKGDVVPGYGWIFPLGDGRVNVGVGLLSTGGAWKGVNTTKLQEYFVAQTAEAWGLNDESCWGRRPAVDCRWVSPSVHGAGPTPLTIGDAAGHGQSLQRRGNRLRLRDRAARRGGRRRGPGSRDDPSLLGLYDERLEAAYGDYYKVARAFVRVISEPKILSACVGVGNARRAADERAARDHGEPHAQRQRGSGRGWLSGRCCDWPTSYPNRRTPCCSASDGRATRAPLGRGSALDELTRDNERCWSVEVMKDWLAGH